MVWDRHQCGQWMDRSAGGDTQAFNLLARAAQDELFRLALRRGLSDADAAEAVQETLTRAYQGRDRWRAGADAAAWLCGIAGNVVHELLRRRRRAAGPAASSMQFDGGDDATSTLADPSDGAAEIVSRADDAEQLRLAIAALPDRQREAICLRFLQQQSVRETAQTMGCAEGTVKATVFAAMESLRKALGQQQ